MIFSHNFSFIQTHVLFLQELQTHVTERWISYLVECRRISKL